MKTPRLGVNIDHVATLRQQRGENYPSIARASQLALSHGADQITIHLREDRRHIQDSDLPEVFAICQEMDRALNLEMGVTEEMVEKAILFKPQWVCLVPEKRQERTTEGGLDLRDSFNFNKLQKSCERIKKFSPQTRISLFVEADEEILRRCLLLPVDAVEIHTGEFARDFHHGKDINHHLDQFKRGQEILKGSNFNYHAGHGLTLNSVKPLLASGIFEEYNIGHWIVCESLFLGLGPVVKSMRDLFNLYKLKEN